MENGSKPSPVPVPWVPQGSRGILAASASFEIPKRGRVEAELEPLRGCYWWHRWGLAARWHGAAAEPGPGREALVYCGEAGTRKRRSGLRPFPYPEPRSSRAGSAGCLLERSCFCLVLCAKDLPGQAEAPQITPGVCVWNRFIPGEQERGVPASAPLGHRRCLFHMLLLEAGLEPSHLQPAPAGAAG